MFLGFIHFWPVLFGRKSFHNPPLKSGEFHCTSLRAAVPFSSQSPTPSSDHFTPLTSLKLLLCLSFSQPWPCFGFLLSARPQLPWCPATLFLPCQDLTPLTAQLIQAVHPGTQALCDLPPRTCSYLSHPPVAPAIAQLTIPSLTLTCAATAAQTLPTTPTMNPGFNPGIFFLWNSLHAQE